MTLRVGLNGHGFVCFCSIIHSKKRISKGREVFCTLIESDARSLIEFFSTPRVGLNGHVIFFNESFIQKKNKKDGLQSFASHID